MNGFALPAERHSGESTNQHAQQEAVNKAGHRGETHFRTPLPQFCQTAHIGMQNRPHNRKGSNRCNSRNRARSAGPAQKQHRASTHRLLTEN